MNLEELKKTLAAMPNPKRKLPKQALPSDKKWVLNLFRNAADQAAYIEALVWRVGRLESILLKFMSEAGLSSLPADISLAGDPSRPLSIKDPATLDAESPVLATVLELLATLTPDQLAQRERVRQMQDRLDGICGRLTREQNGPMMS